MTQFSNNSDNYYYHVNGRKTASKAQALFWARGQVDQVKFYNIDHVWDTVKWANEPAKSINELCRERCQQLRDTHSWLCLWLSAGYDSQTVLTSFIESGAILDEIAFMDRSEYYADPELPAIQTAIEAYKKFINPNLRVRHIKIDAKYTAKIYSALREQWVMAPGAQSRLSKSSPTFVHQWHDKSPVFTESSLTGRCDIYGKEKPTLNLVDGHWWVMSIDSKLADSIGSLATGFYSSPEFVQLEVKQVHLAMRFFESIPGITHEQVHRIQSNDTVTYQAWNRALGRQAIDTAVSADARTKLPFVRTVGKPGVTADSVKIAQHFTAAEARVESYFSNGYRFMAENSPGADLSKTIMGKSWYVRPFEAR